MSTEEKRKLGGALTRLSPEDLTKALEIVAQNNPGFQATAEEVDLDIDAQVIIYIIIIAYMIDSWMNRLVKEQIVQSETTLWRLKFFVKDALEVQGKSAASAGGRNNTTTPGNNNNNNNKRKREICDAIAKTAKKRSKKPSSWSYCTVDKCCYGFW